MPQNTHGIRPETAIELHPVISIGYGLRYQITKALYENS